MDGGTIPMKNSYVERWRAWRHLQELIRFRTSGVTLDAANDWLDKEIQELTHLFEAGETSEQAG